MREALREVDRAVDEVRAERDAVAARRLQAARQQGLLTRRIASLTEKARFAIDGGRDDLAEAALSQQLDFEAQARRLDEVQAQAREEETRLDEGAAALRARRTLMEDALSADLLARREASPDEGGQCPAGSAARRAAAAEQVFARAMAGGALPRVDLATLGRVAEIDVLQRSAAIAERLAGLKARRATW